MLTPEQADLRLKAAVIPEFEQWRLKAIVSLPDEPLDEKIRRDYVQELMQDQKVLTTISLRSIAYELIGHTHDGKPITGQSRNIYDLRRGFTNGSGKAILLLSSVERLQI